jgi:hypothetical protein
VCERARDAVWWVVRLLRPTPCDTPALEMHDSGGRGWAIPGEVDDQTPAAFCESADILHAMY